MATLRGRSRHTSVAIAAMLCAGGLSSISSLAHAAVHDTTLVSRATSPSEATGGAVGYTDISGNGRYVVFSTTSSNLDADDTDGTEDVYVRDREQNTTTLISRATSGVKSNGASSQPVISDDGRYVAFTSDATNLSAEDVNEVSDVYVRDLTSNTTTLVSRADGVSGAVASYPTLGSGGSDRPAISGDGQHISFSTGANNFDLSDTDYPISDVYVRRFHTSASPTTVLVSRADGASGSKGDGDSLRSAISADGRYVAFDSNSANLDPDATTQDSEIYLRDVTTSTTTLVSRGDGLDADDGNALSILPSMSPDGRFVVFSSRATNLDSAATDETDTQIYRRDMQTSDTTLVSRADGATGVASNGNSGMALGADVSIDGRYVVFSTEATNLDPEDPDATEDVFRRDLTTNDTTLISRASGAAGPKGNQQSGLPHFSADATLVAFISHATNFDPADTVIDSDAYVRELALGPTHASLGVTKSGDGSGTVSSNPDGINCGTVCSAQFALGTSTVLTAAPDGGSTFTAWTGCDSVAGGQCTVTVGSSRSVDAQFSLASGPGAPGPAARSLTLAPSKTRVLLGKRVTLSGRVDAGGLATCAGGQQVGLQRLAKPRRSFVGFGQATTDGRGRYSLKIKVRKAAKYRAVLLGTLACGATTSNSVTVKLKQP